MFSSFQKTHKCHIRGASFLWKANNAQTTAMHVALPCMNSCPVAPSGALASGADAPERPVYFRKEDSEGCAPEEYPEVYEFVTGDPEGADTEV